MASLTRWTWVWVNSGSWWWTGRPGVLQFMWSQRVRHNWVTELNWTDSFIQLSLLGHFLPRGHVGLYWDTLGNRRREPQENGEGPHNEGCVCQPPQCLSNISQPCLSISAKAHWPHLRTEAARQKLACTWMGGEFGEEWIHAYVWLCPFAVHLFTTFLIRLYPSSI